MCSPQIKVFHSSEEKYISHLRALLLLSVGKPIVRDFFFIVRSLYYFCTRLSCACYLCQSSLHTVFPAKVN